MYAPYWRLTDSPFTSRVDPRTYVQTPVHEEACARLLYLIEQRRHCGVLLGDRGCGKTMILQVLARHLRRTQATVVYEDLLGATGIETAWKIANSLGCRSGENPSVPRLWRSLQDSLEGTCSAGRPTVILLDHVERADVDCQGILHRLIHSTLSLSGYVTVLLSLRTEDVFAFQSFLKEVSDLRIELGPLNPSQTREYVKQQIENHGGSDDLFEPDVWDLLYNFSAGNPREIHRLCDLALVAGMSQQATSISRRHLVMAGEDLSTILWNSNRTGTITTTNY